MTKRTITFLCVALVLAAVCVRLGFWQLDRLDQRRARNRPIAARVTATPASASAVLRDSQTAQYRRVIVSGTYDFTNEIVLGPRSNQGSPGVNLLTPLRLAGTDTAILVNRGWVYAADAMTVDLGRWRETDTATVSGYLDAFSADTGRARGNVTAASGSRVVRKVVRDSVAARLGYPVAPLILVQLAAMDTREGAAAPETPVRLDPPSLDEGPHRGYAMQWFAFATIAVVGSLAVAVKERRPSRSARG